MAELKFNKRDVLISESSRLSDTRRPRRKRRTVNPNGADVFDVTDCLAKKDRCAAWSEKDRDPF
jgi:hypothetical protein